MQCWVMEKLRIWCYINSPSSKQIRVKLSTHLKYILLNSGEKLFQKHSQVSWDTAIFCVFGITLVLRLSSKLRHLLKRSMCYKLDVKLHSLWRFCHLTVAVPEIFDGVSRSVAFLLISIRTHPPYHVGPTQKRHDTLQRTISNICHAGQYIIIEYTQRIHVVSTVM